MSAPDAGPQPGWHRLLSVVRGVRPILIPLILLLAGLGIALASLSPDIEARQRVSFAGTVSPGDAIISLTSVRAQYVQVTLVAGECDLHVYLATSAESDEFNSTGQLPARSFGCPGRTLTTNEAVNNILILNQGPVSEPYNMSVYSYSITTPYAWVAIPGTALALTGLILIVPRVVLHQTLKLKDECDLKREKERK